MVDHVFFLKDEVNGYATLDKKIFLSRTHTIINQQYD